MRKIILGIFFAGAILTWACSQIMSGVDLVAVILAVPLIALYVVEWTGFIRFEMVDMDTEEGNPNSLLDKAAYERLTDAAAADRYGWGIVNEMDEVIKDMELTVTEAKQKRASFADLVRGTKQ